MSDVQQRRRDLISDASQKAALSGLASGGAIAAGTRILAGVRSPLALLRAATIGGLGASGIAGGGTYLGSQMLGPPDEDETNPYTRRGGIGGAIGGSAIGAGVGALLASGVLRRAAPSLLKLIRQGPADNVLGDQFFKLAKKPTTGRTLLGTALGGTTGGTIAGLMGADEGGGVDIINNEISELAKRRELERRRRQWT